MHNDKRLLVNVERHRLMMAEKPAGKLSASDLQYLLLEEIKDLMIQQNNLMREQLGKEPINPAPAPEVKSDVAFQRPSFFKRRRLFKKR